MQSEIYHHFNKWLYLLVLVAGGLSVFAFAPFKLYPLAWLTPAVLFYALSKANTKKEYFKLGFVFGIGFYGAGASWPFYSMYFFAHLPLPVALFGTSLFVLMLALLTTGLFGWLASLFRHRPLFARLLLFYPAAWVMFEWFREWFLTGFPWLYLGNSQIDGIFAAYAPITGVLGVSYVSVLIAGALLSFFIGNSVQRVVHIPPDPDSRLVNTNMQVEERLSSSIRILSALIIILLTVAAIALENVNWTTQTGKAIKVSVLQSNISQEEKLDPNSLIPSLALYRSMTKASRGSDLIVWAETSLFDSFNRHMKSLILPLQGSIRKRKQSILIGGFHINENNQVENSVLALSSDAREIYSKRHLVPFGEYIPMLEYVRLLEKWIALPPFSNIESGVNSGTLEVAGQIAQMTICYEDAFGSEMIKSMPQATMLINVSHDGWFSHSLEPEQHMQIARMRSLEMGRYMVRSTTTGPSGIIDEKGNLIATAPIYTRKVITHKVQPFTGLTPYARWGNYLIVGIISFVLLLGLIWKREE